MCWRNFKYAFLLIFFEEPKIRRGNAHFIMAYTMKCALLACVFLCLIVQTQSTLSKSGSKDKEEASSPKKSSPKIGKRQDEAKEVCLLVFFIILEYGCLIF